MDRRSLLQSGPAFLAMTSSVLPRTGAEPETFAEAVANVLNLVQQIRPGDLRKSLDLSWQEDGGIQVPSPMRYLLRTCKTIKIDVKFRQVDVTRAFGTPDDIIVSVSKPYLEYPAYD